MTIQGGGGRNVPPGGSSRLNSAERAPIASHEPRAPAATTAPTTTTTPPPARPRDGFETARPVDPRLASERAALPTLEHTTNSGIESTIRLLEARRDEILEEHRALREQAWKLVGDLARGGFERTAVETRRAELAVLRDRLAHQRRRLQLIRRRLRAALQRTTKQGDVDVGRTIQANLDKMKKLEPGVQKALHALVAMEHAFSGALDAAGLPAAMVAPSSSSSPSYGDALSRSVPGAVVATSVGRLLGQGPANPSSLSSSPEAPNDPALQGLQSFAEQILSAL